MKTGMMLINTAFRPADDAGWYQIAPLGEFPAATKDRTPLQVIDEAAVTALANSFAGFLLVDFDHFSLDNSRSSEAAGWIKELQARADGLYARVDWSDIGEAAVKGKRFRFFSPVWNREDCEDLGGGRVRPLRLASLALTNAPNLPHRPIFNRNPNEEVTMTAIAKALGLPDDADEAAVLEAIKGLKQSEAEARARAAELEQAENEAKADEVLNRYAEEIEDKAAVRKQLLANRAGVEEVLKGLKKAAAAAPDSSKLPNRKDGKLPAFGKGAEEHAAEDAAAAAIRNRAAEIRHAEPHLTFRAAWDRAEAETHNRRP